MQRNGREKVREGGGEGGGGGGEGGGGEGDRETYYIKCTYARH